MMWYDGGYAFGWLWMAGMMVLFWGGVLVVAVWAIRNFTERQKTGDAALDLLRRRFAAGEISAEEFEKSKKALGA